jgi:hypothetical protein
MTPDDASHGCWCDQVHIPGALFGKYSRVEHSEQRREALSQLSIQVKGTGKVTVFLWGRPGRTILCGLTSCVLFALAACSTSSANEQPFATAPRSSTATATTSLATAHFDWKVLPNLPAGAADVAFAPSNPRTGLLCTSVNSSTSIGQPKLYKTSDGGQSWQEVTEIARRKPQGFNPSG